MKRYTTTLILLIVSYTMMYAQDEVAENSQSMVVMSEADLVSLAKTLRKHKKESLLNIPANGNLNNQFDTQTNSLGDTTFEADYLRNRTTQLETQLNNLSKGQRNTVTGIESSPPMNDSALKNLKYEMSQLKYAIRQLSNKPSDNLVVVTPPQNQASNMYQQPRDLTIREQVPVNNNNELMLSQKLDSMNRLLKNMKQADNPNYSGDFDALQKRIDALKNDMLAMNSMPSNYDKMVSQYKHYNRDIYFADNSRILNAEASQAIEELFAILDSNDNLDIVVKGFASNKGNAVYNENLSMQRTETVKKALMIRGIHPTRVLTQYHGIDYQAQIAAEARRVEVSILVRK